MYRSKCSAVSLPPDYDSCSISHCGLNKPACHPMMADIHAGVSSTAAEVYAASVALNKFSHLSHVTDEMGFEFPIPLTLEVDNQTAIHFSKGSTKCSKLKHIDARQSWVEALHDNTIPKFDWVPTTENLADLNSKFLDTVRFCKLQDRILQLCAIPSLQTSERGTAGAASGR